MGDQRSDSVLCLAEQDQRVQSAVLFNLLELYPAPVMLSELIREMVSDPNDFGECDGVECAVTDLAGAGLLHRHGSFVALSRAAVRASELFEMP